MSEFMSEHQIAILLVQGVYYILSWFVLLYSQGTG